MRRTPSVPVVLSLLASVLLVLAGCGGQDTVDADQASPTKQATPDGSSMEASAAAMACRLVEGLPPDIKKAVRTEGGFQNMNQAMKQTDDLLQEPLLYRLQALGPLARAAAQADERYSTLGELGKRMHDAYVRLRTEKMADVASDLRTECADLGL